MGLAGLLVGSAGPLFFVKICEKFRPVSSRKSGRRPVIFGRWSEKWQKSGNLSKKSGRMASFENKSGREKCSIINGLRALRPVVQLFFYLNAK